MRLVRATSQTLRPSRPRKNWTPRAGAAGRRRRPSGQQRPGGAVPAVGVAVAGVAGDELGANVGRPVPRPTASVAARRPGRRRGRRATAVSDRGAASGEPQGDAPRARPTARHGRRAASSGRQHQRAARAAATSRTQRVGDAGRSAMPCPWRLGLVAGVSGSIRNTTNGQEHGQPQHHRQGVELHQPVLERPQRRPDEPRDGRDQPGQRVEEAVEHAGQRSPAHSAGFTTSARRTPRPRTACSATGRTRRPSAARHRLRPAVAVRPRTPARRRPARAACSTTGDRPVEVRARRRSRRSAAFACCSDGVVPRKSLNQCVNGSTSDARRTRAPTASTISGTVITGGDSWAWCPASGGIRSSPQKVRKYARKV